MAAPAPNTTERSDWSWLLRAPTFPALVRARAQATPDLLFLVDEQGMEVTCAQYAERVDRVAAGLAAQGIGPGSRVAWQLPTRISTLLVMAALRRLGAVQAPVIPLYREREVTVALTATEADFFLVPGTWRDFDYVEMASRIAADGGPDPRLVVVGEEAPERADTSALPAEPTDPDEIAWIYFTSGSTGAPKGAQHTDATLLATGSGFAGNGRLGAEGRDMGAMAFPVAHVGGIQYLISALAGGYGLVLMEAFVPDQAVAVMARHGVTTTGGAPPFYSALVAMGRAAGSGAPLLPSLRLLKGGGAPCPPDLYRQVREVLGVQLAHDYGMTEVPMIAVADPRDPDDVLAETDGRVLPVNRVRIAAPDGSSVPDGETGEVQVSGGGVCKGYTDAAETAKAFTEDGWFRTGDLGRLRSTGHIEVVGRLKDLIIRKGENIAPQEIEELLAQHPAVAEVAVLGVPDADRGERVCAVVVTAAGAEEPTLTELTGWLRGKGLMAQKLPEQLELVDVLPRTGLAKIAKNELRQRFATTRSGAGSGSGVSG